MRPKRYDLVDTINATDPTASVLRGVRTGADWTFAVKFYTVYPGTPEVLTSKTFAFQVRPAADDPTILAQATTADIVTVDGSGNLAFTLPKAKTALLPLGMAVYTLNETTGGKSEPRMEGAFQVVKGVLR